MVLFALYSDMYIVLNNISTVTVVYTSTFIYYAAGGEDYDYFYLKKNCSNKKRQNCYCSCFSHSGYSIIKSHCVFLKKNQTTPRSSEHPPVMGKKMSKRLGGIKKAANTKPLHGI